MNPYSQENENGVNPVESTIQVAAIVKRTYALGPGLRAAIWVQGCPFHCEGCIAPDWIPFQSDSAQFLPVSEVVNILLEDPLVTGLTFSGGEPMLQARELAAVARMARERKNLNIICFTGFRYEFLLKMGAQSDAHALLAEIDVLIDGGYMAAKNDNLGLRGSSNQRVHHLRPTIKDFDFEHQPRNVEISIEGNHLIMVGVPPLKIAEMLTPDLLMERSF